MRRLALLLATSVMGAGCYSSSDYYPPPGCDPTTITVRWPSFQLANGAVTSSCGVAGVSSVEVFLNDVSVQRLACGAGGLTITGVTPGQNIVTVEGLDGAGTILLRDDLTVPVATCGDTLVDTQPAEGLFNLAYYFTPVNQCSPGSYIWFSVHDQLANVTAAVADETNSTTAYACPATISFPLPVGRYTLQRVEEVVPAGASWAATATNCTATTFDVVGARASDVNVPLRDSTVFCP